MGRKAKYSILWLIYKNNCIFIIKLDIIMVYQGGKNYGMDYYSSSNCFNIIMGSIYL